MIQRIFIAPKVLHSVFETCSHTPRSTLQSTATQSPTEKCLNTVLAREREEFEGTDRQTDSTKNLNSYLDWEGFALGFSILSHTHLGRHSRPQHCTYLNSFSLGLLDFA